MNNRFIKILKNPFVISLLLAVLILWGLIYGTLVWLDIYTRHNEAVVIPDVKGMTIEEAAPFLAEKGIRYNIIDSVFSKDVDPGAIVEIVPTPGSKVKEGRIVFVTINAKTSQMACIPEVQDLSFRQAYALLTSIGFKAIEVKYVAGDYKDLAIGVEWNGKILEEGQHVPLNAHLTLVVSGGFEESDSLALDCLNMAPVESLDSEEENWFLSWQTLLTK